MSRAARACSSCYATSGGVWFGSDSCCISGERHERLAWLPIAGGTAVPAPSVFHLPNELWKLPVNGCSSVDASILYRVNAGGRLAPELGLRYGLAGRRPDHEPAAEHRQQRG